MQDDTKERGVGRARGRGRSRNQNVSSVRDPIELVRPGFNVVEEQSDLDRERDASNINTMADLLHSESNIKESLSLPPPRIPITTKRSDIKSTVSSSSTEHQTPPINEEELEGAVGGVKKHEVDSSISHIDRGISKINLSNQSRNRSNSVFQFDDVYTKPSRIVDKRGVGESSANVDIITNSYVVECDNNSTLQQYRVDFDPEMPSKGFRKNMLKTCMPEIGHIYLFDGMTLYLPKKLDKEKCEIIRQRVTDGLDVRIIITFTNTIPPGSPTIIHIYNIIFKMVMTRRKLVPVGRNYFDPKRAIEIRQHRLEIWPGFTSSILQFETGLMLIFDVCHKVLNIDTVLDTMYNIKKWG